ncbi:MAG: ATP-binding protein [Acetobacteraceae bacterium]
MKLSTRLLLIILGCLLPVVTAQVFSLVQLQARRHAQLEKDTLRRTVAVSHELDDYLGNLTHLATMAGQFAVVREAGPGCSDRLQTVMKGVPALRFLATAAADGALTCAAPAVALPPSADWLGDARQVSEAHFGRASSFPESDKVFVPLVVPVPDAGPDAPARFVVAGIDSDLLAAHLQASRLPVLPPGTSGTIFIAAPDGTIIARVPPAQGGPSGASSVGQSLPEGLRPLLAATAPTIESLTDTAEASNGGRMLATVVPSGPAGLGLPVIQTASLPNFAAGPEYPAMLEFLVVGVSAVLALVLAWFAGRRFIYRPTEDLLSAARRWEKGDLTARADVADAGSEFAALARSYNAMAAGLQAREVERRAQAEFLEARVADRTRELSESNNRLQVEIAGRERTEAALHQAQKLQAVGQLAGGIAHDFNNMLATVLGNLELMERRVASGAKQWTQADIDRLSKLIERASGAVQRGAQLTSRLLAFSRRQRLTARATDLNALVNDLVTLVSSTLGRRVRVSADLAPDLGFAMVDASQIEAAILNLCLNARDAMPEGGDLVISTANETLTDRDLEDDPPPGRYVRVMVKDTGVGMTPEVRRQAFDPFFTTKGPGGSGLGLSQVYGMARQSGGTVRIESVLGGGTEVTILLPRAPDDVVPEVERVTKPSAPAFRAGPAELVLVVDDDAAVRQVTVEMLHDLGFDVIQASGGPEALGLVASLPRQPRFVLLDYAMPEMNGLELARRLREAGLNVPTALITGYAELAGANADAILLDGLLRKPFTIPDLQGLLERLRARAAAQPALMPQS